MKKTTKLLIGLALAVAAAVLCALLFGPRAAIPCAQEVGLKPMPSRKGRRRSLHRL